jgi:transcriptional regulator with XRE-family HTH domain
MMNKTARKHKSPIIDLLLNEITPEEKMQVRTKMALAARLDDLMKQKELGKSELAAKLNKHPSEITKWLSGEHNFTVDTLSDIAVALNVTVAEFFVPKVAVIQKTHIVVTSEYIPVHPVPGSASALVAMMERPWHTLAGGSIAKPSAKNPYNAFA